MPMSSELSSVETRALTKSILKKLDLYILPPLALLWLANFIDRTNVGNARIAGLEKDTRLHGNQFNTALAASNWVLKKIKANRWLPFLVFLWGVVTTLSGLVENFAGLVAVRFVLGACEGGILPGIILYLSTIYKRHELQLRVGVFYASGLLATAIIKMDGVGNLAGWRWIFILEGIATCLLGVLAAMILPASISSAKFLTKEEKQFAQTHDATNPDNETAIVHQEEEQFEWREVFRGLTDIQAWLTGIGYMGLIVSLYSYSLFFVFTVPPYVPATVLTIVVAFAADRFKMRGPMILICLPLSIIGYIIIITAKSNEVRYAAVFLIATGLYPCAPCILSIIPNNTSGHYKKATAVALQLGVANAGYVVDQAPKYIRGHSITLAFVSMAWVLVAINV
ncbi:major facilitator superfamily [Heterobasidion irregulare TC 32-1]|uniref:Major facilitator superfamily n=1 Tax=Heterobasidion irregulare (strain TC 32-1) TaxID=747525 RepID=W4KG43_HETIT|nr:major facilitator superfamily [Heterobasidion irregulare TC 32-1]ETW84041.1 major facilitator superfamily [Heterobasidion irregulare TC 32-1]